MEKIKVIPEDLEGKFRSKQDLYNMLTIDLNYHLPPYEKCPLHFLREVMEGNKKVVYLDVPRYKELSVQNIWPLITDVEDLLQYFPTCNPGQMPDREYMFSILATLRNEETNTMIQNSRKNRSAITSNDDKELVYINTQLYNEIKGVSAQKLTKGRAAHLLKRSAKLHVSRKSAKTYPISFENLKKQREESKEEEDMA